MDFLDLLKPKTDMFCKGTYYKERPNITYEEATEFITEGENKWSFRATTKPIAVKVGNEVIDEIYDNENGTYYFFYIGEITSGSYLANITSVSQLKGGKWFDYDITDERFKQYSTVENLQVENKTLTIVSRDRLGFKPKKHIVTQDGELWQILAVRETTDNKEPLRMLKTSNDTKFIISLVALDNVWDIK